MQAIGGLAECDGQWMGPGEMCRPMRGWQSVQGNKLEPGKMSRALPGWQSKQGNKGLN